MESRYLSMVATDTTGEIGGPPPRLPPNGRSEKLKTPPSSATAMYPSPYAAMAVTAALRARVAMDPRNAASPNEKTPPSEATSQ
jgi:hypothetical protein